MAQTIQLRRGTAAQWTAANPTLAQGEAGLETDSGKLKFGTGATAWTALAYFSAASNSSFALNNVATNAAKLALTGIAPGYMVQITGEGNRVEQYIGGAISSDTSWRIIGNDTVHLYVDAQGNSANVSANLNGVALQSYSITDCGWVDPHNFYCDNYLMPSNSSGYSGYGDQFSNENNTPKIAAVFINSPLIFSGTNSLPVYTSRGVAVIII